jgi:hypothetical protein
MVIAMVVGKRFRSIMKKTELLGLTAIGIAVMTASVSIIQIR